MPLNFSIANLFRGIFGTSPKTEEINNPALEPLITTSLKKEIDDLTNNIANGNTINECPYKKKKNKTGNINCNFKQLKISKKDRGFDLVINNLTPVDKCELSVVGGCKRNPAKINIELVGAIGPCIETHANLKSFNFGGDDIKPDGSEDKITAKLFADTLWDLSLFGKKEILSKRTLPWNAEPVIYIIGVDRCNTDTINATLKVYPDIEVDGFISYDFGTKTESIKTQTTITKRNVPLLGAKTDKKIESNSTKSFKTTEISKGFTLGGGITSDGTEYSLEYSFNELIDTVKKIDEIKNYAIKTLKQIRDGKEAAEALNALSPDIETTLNLPNIKIELSGAWYEQPDKPTCIWDGTVSISAKPLFGIDLTWDVTDSIIKYSLSPGVAIIKKALEKNGLTVLKIILKIGAKIEGELTFQISEGIIPNGEITGLIPFSVECTAIKFEMKIFIISISVDLSIEIETGIKLGIEYDKNTNPNTLFINGEILDLVIYFVGKLEIGGAKEDSNSNEYGVPKEKKDEKTKEKELKPKYREPIEILRIPSPFKKEYPWQFYQ